jgi:hypothetical protein
MDLKAILPQGWSVAEGDSEIVITRDEEVWFCDSFSRPTMSAKELDLYVKKKGARAKYTIRLRLADAVSRDALALQKSKNAQAELELRSLRGQMQHIKQRADVFYPMTPSEQKLVDQFHALQKTIVPIPDGTLSGRSVFLSSNLEYPNTIHPPDVHDECTRVYEKIETLLER